MKGKFRAVLSVFLVIAIAMSLGTSAFAARKKAQTAADIADQMAKNSAAWHEADAATRKQLEAENAALRQQYAEKTGDNVTYDPATGKTTATNKNGETTYKNESTRNEKTGRMETNVTFKDEENDQEVHYEIGSTNMYKNADGDVTADQHIIKSTVNNDGTIDREFDNQYITNGSGIVTQRDAIDEAKEWLAEQGWPETEYNIAAYISGNYTGMAKAIAEEGVTGTSVKYVDSNGQVITDLDIYGASSKESLVWAMQDLLQGVNNTEFKEIWGGIDDVETSDAIVELKTAYSNLEKIPVGTPIDENGTILTAEMKQDMLDEIHQKAEDIRAEHGYSGGHDGGYYIPVESSKPLIIVADNEDPEPDPDRITPKISVDKYADKYAVKVGDTVTYTIVVSNTGDCNLVDVVVDERGFSGDFSQIKDVKGATVDRTNECFKIKSLKVNASQVITFAYEITEAETLSNTVKATGEPDKNKDGKPDNDPELPPPSDTDKAPDIEVDPNTDKASISVKKTVDKTSAAIGDTITYTIDVRNNGNVKLVDVKVDESSFTGDFSQIFGVSSTGGKAFTSGAGFVIDAMSPGEDVSISFSYKATEAGSLSNTVVVTGDPDRDNDGEPDNDPNDPPPTDEDDSPDVKITPDGEKTPSISVSKSVDKVSAAAGDTVTYTIKVTNNGNVKLVDIIVDEHEFSGDFSKIENISGATVNKANKTFTINALQPGDSVTIKFSYKVTETGKLTNTVVATGKPDADDDGKPDDDPNLPDPTDEDKAPDVETVTKPSIKVTKTVNKQQIVLSNINDTPETITYTITVTNNGNVNLVDLIVDESGFSGDFSKIENVKGATANKSSKTFSIPALAVGETKQITFNYSTTDIGKLSNTVVVTGEPDANKDGKPDNDPDVPDPKDDDKAPDVEIVPPDNAMVFWPVSVSWTPTEGGYISYPGITASEKSSGGYSVAVPQNSDVTFSIIPAEGYKIKDVKVNGASSGAIGSHSFMSVDGSRTISAEFEKGTPGTAETYYYITVTCGEGGKVSPKAGVHAVKAGGNISFNFDPMDGFVVSNVIVDGTTEGNPGSYAFTNVQANHTLNVNFAAPSGVPIEVSAKGLGTVTSNDLSKGRTFSLTGKEKGTNSSTVETEENSTVTFNLKAFDGWITKSVTGNGFTRSGNTVTFKKIKKSNNNSLSVVFAEPKLEIGKPSIDSPGSFDPDSDTLTLKAGYGFEAELPIETFEGMTVQSVTADYDFKVDKGTVALESSGGGWRFPVWPGSKTNAHKIYVPVNTPDGSYKVLFTAIGTYVDDNGKTQTKTVTYEMTVTIRGTMYEDDSSIDQR